MSKLRVQNFAVSLDGYGTGPNQDLQHPLGVNGPELMEWFVHTRLWQRMHGQEDGDTGIDNEVAASARRTSFCARARDASVAARACAGRTAGMRTLA